MPPAPAATTAPSLQGSRAPSSARRGRRRTRRWIKRGLLIVGALAVIAALVYAWLPKPVPVDLATVHRGPLEVTVDDDGQTRVRDRYVVAAPIGGNLLRIELDPGAEVQPGAVVARVTPPEPAILDERTRAAAEARLRAASAQLQQAEAAIRRARVGREAASREAVRTRELARRGAVTGTEREQADDAENVARSELVQAEMSRAAADAEVAAARAALGQGVPASSETIPITAPTGGRVLRLLRESAGPVAAGTPLIEMGDLRALEVVIDVLSSDAARIAIGAPAWIEAWGGDHPLAGRVREIEPSAFTRISALGIEEQRVNVILAIDHPPPQLGDGFRVEARIVIWRGDDVLQIPASAVFRDRERWAVYVIEDGRARLQPVELGHRGKIEVEVRAGLPDQAVVIVHPGDRITDGVRISRR